MIRKAPFQLDVRTLLGFVILACQVVTCAQEQREAGSIESATRPKFAFVGIGSDSDSHTSNINALMFSPDGKLLASASDDKTVRIWNATSQKIQAILKGHLNYVYCLAFSPDGTVLASGSADCTVRLWSTSTWSEIQILKGHQFGVQDVAFSPKGNVLATASSDATVCLWDPKTAGLIRKIEGHKKGVQTVVFSPDEKTIASGSADSTIRICSIETGELIRAIDGHKDYIFCLAVSVDAKTLVSGGSDHVIRMWEFATGKLVGALEAHTDSVNRIAFSPDGKILASSGHDEKVRLWDAVIGKEICAIDNQGQIAFSPDGRRLVTANADHRLCLWNLRPIEVAGKLDVEGLWETLASGDAPGAYCAIWSLAGSEKAPAFLREKLNPSADEKHFKELLAQLSAQSIELRAAAESALADASFVGLLLAELNRSEDTEGRERIKRILRPWEEETTPDARRRSKAIQALERIGTKPACDTLRLLSENSPVQRERREAKGALKRITAVK